MQLARRYRQPNASRAPMGDQNALFAQYEAEYCTSSTNVARKIQGLSIIAGGTLLTPFPHLAVHPPGPRWMLPAPSELTVRHRAVSRATTRQSARSGERPEGGGPNRTLFTHNAL